MISGETEDIVATQLGEDLYDNFLFRGKRRRNASFRANRFSRRATNRQRRLNQRGIRRNNRFARKASRQQARAQRRAIRRTIKRVPPRKTIRRQRRRSFIKRIGTSYRNAGGATGIGAAIDAATLTSSQTNSGQTPESSDYSVSLNNNSSKEKTSGIPKVAYILGGIAVLGIVGVMIMKSRTPKYPYQQG